MATPSSRSDLPRSRSARARCVITGHTPMPEPAWHENVLDIDTGVHIDHRGYGRLTIARIDGREIETLRFDR